MPLLFPSDYFAPTQPDRDYADEAATATAQGYEVLVFDLDALTRGETQQAVRRLPQANSETALLYRGWMLRHEHYVALDAMLRAKNYRLLTDPESYVRTHDFSLGAPILAQYGPPNLVFPGTSASFDEAHLRSLAQTVAQTWPQTALVLKDFVKSQKYAWNEACFIPATGNPDAFLRVTRRFLELQGEELQGGLVYRPFVPLREVGREARTQMPLHAEYRAFYWQGQRLWSSPRHLACDYGDLKPDWARFEGLVAQIDSPFWTLDVAAVASEGQERYGEWIALEMGDGQVSGLPDASQAGEFYHALAGVWPPQ